MGCVQQQKEEENLHCRKKNIENPWWITIHHALNKLLIHKKKNCKFLRGFSQSVLSSLYKLRHCCGQTNNKNCSKQFACCLLVWIMKNRKIWKKIIENLNNRFMLSDYMANGNKRREFCCIVKVFFLLLFLLWNSTKVKF